MSVMLRNVEPSDLEIFYAQQLDPEAIRMAAFVAADPTDNVAFNVHWTKILAASQNTNRTILDDGQVAGYIACYPHGEGLEVTYWLGREFWGRGIATRALEMMLHLVIDRPIFARVATDNLGSLRVLQKCGFQIAGRNSDFAHGRGADTEEYILRLDPVRSRIGVRHTATGKMRVGAGIEAGLRSSGFYFRGNTVPAG